MSEAEFTAVNGVLQFEDYKAKVTQLEGVQAKNGQSYTLVAEVLGIRDLLVVFAHDGHALASRLEGVISAYRHMAREGGAERRRDPEITEPRLSYADLMSLASGSTYQMILIDHSPLSADRASRDAKLRTDALTHAQAREYPEVVHDPERFYFRNVFSQEIGVVGPDEEGRPVYGNTRSLNVGGFWIYRFGDCFNWMKLSEAKLLPFVAQLLHWSYDGRHDGPLWVKNKWLPGVSIASLTADGPVELTWGDEDITHSVFLEPVFGNDGSYHWKALDDQDQVIEHKDWPEGLSASYFFSQNDLCVTLIDLIWSGVVEVRGRPNDALARRRIIDQDVFSSPTALLPGLNNLKVGASKLWNVEVRLSVDVIPKNVPYKVVDGEIHVDEPDWDVTVDTDESDAPENTKTSRLQPQLPESVFKKFVSTVTTEKKRLPIRKEYEEEFEGRYNRKSWQARVTAFNREQNNSHPGPRGAAARAN